MFRKIKDAGLSVNVPRDAAVRRGEGPDGYEAVFGSYDVEINKKKARSYVHLCSNIKQGITQVPPCYRDELAELGFSRAKKKQTQAERAERAEEKLAIRIATKKSIWDKRMEIFRKIKDAGLSVNVPQDLAYISGDGPKGYDLEDVFGSYDVEINKKTARSYVNLCSNIKQGKTQVPPCYRDELAELGLDMVTKKRKREEAH